MLQHCGTRGRRQSSSEPLLSSPAEIDSEAASVSPGRCRRRRRQAWQGHLQHESRSLSARRRLQAATAQLEEANAITALSSTVVRRGEDGEGGGGRESGNEGSTRDDAPEEEEEEEEEDGDRSGYCYCCGGYRAYRWRGRLERVFRRRRRGSEDVVVRQK